MSASPPLCYRLQPPEPADMVRVLPLRYTGQKATDKVIDWLQSCMLPQSYPGVSDVSQLTNLRLQLRKKSCVGTVVSRWVGLWSRCASIVTDACCAPAWTRSVGCSTSEGRTGQ